MAVTLPPTTDQLTLTWHALFAVHQRLPAGWCLVGGQLVHLLCAERGFEAIRPTLDADTVVDVRTDHSLLSRFTTTLVDLGFKSAGVSPEGHEHRWLRDDQQIDVLVPGGLRNPGSVRGVTGATTVTTHGAQQALQRAEPVTVDVAGTVGTIHRPHLLGALVMKAAAIWADGANRHIEDFLTLAAIARPADHIETATRADRRYLIAAIRAAREYLPQSHVPEASEALQAIEMRLAGQG